MDDGEGLFILAAVVIGFVNWLSNTLKEKAAERDRAKRIARGETVGSPPTPEEEVWQQPTETPIQTDNPSAQLRAFFDSIGQPGSASSKPEPSPRTPTPARTIIPPAQPATEPAPDRWKAPEIKRAKLSKAEREALANLRQTSRPKASISRRPKSASHPLVATLREPGGARQAILLAEILGKPKGLAES